MKKITTKIAPILLISMLCVTLASTFNAQTTHAEAKYEQIIIPQPALLPGPKHDPESKYTITKEVLPRFALATIGFVGALSVLFLTIGGVRYMVSYGKEESIENAKKQVIYSLVGFLLAIMSYTIVRLITGLSFGETQSINEEFVQEKQQQQNLK